VTELRADCARCFALCCVALPFARSTDFALDKPAGAACPNLRTDFRCAIHDRLPAAGFAGCVVYDCFGAGQRIAEDTFAGRDWRAHPELGPSMFAAFRTMRHLHELLWYLAAALSWDAAERAHDALRVAQARVAGAASGDATALAALDVDALRAEVAPLLRRASALVRGAGANRSGADLIGADLRTADLRNADLRSALLIRADLRGTDMFHVDLLGADLRGADVRGADLGNTLFLTQAQLNASRADALTTIPTGLARPPTW
jgi:uncharacterized protein YjbI with pentapeptide repeats